MSLELELPPALAAELVAEAKKLGLAVEEYALCLLAKRQTTELPASGADLIAYWQNEGLIGTRPDIDDAPVHARNLREKAQKWTR